MNIPTLSFTRFGSLALLALLAITARQARADDKSDVLAVLNTEQRGYEVFDAKMASGMFSDDAVWMNPFGVHLVGRQKLEHFLTKLFNRPGFRDGKDTSKIAFEVSFIEPNVAIAYGYQESEGEIDDSTGKKMEPRKSHYIEVLRKRDQAWQIVSETIMDEK